MGWVSVSSRRWRHSPWGGLRCREGRREERMEEKTSTYLEMRAIPRAVDHAALRQEVKSTNVVRVRTGAPIVEELGVKLSDSEGLVDLGREGGKGECLYNKEALIFMACCTQAGTPLCIDPSLPPSLPPVLTFNRRIFAMVLQ